MKKLLTMIGAAIAFACSAGGVYAAQGTDSSSKRSGHADVACCVRFSSDSKSHLYKPGDRAVVEAMFADKAGNALKQGVVELWADDGWTNRVWTRTIDLAKDSQPVRMELSRSTPGSLRIHAKGASIRERMDRILFGVDEIMPLTPCPDGFEEYWRGEQRRLEREVPIDARKEPAPDISTSDHDVFRVSFATFGGSRIYGLLAVPKGGGRFPAIVNVPGAGIGHCRFNKEIVRKGWITLMMNVHGFPMGATASEQKRNYDEWFKSYAEAAGEPLYQYVGYSVSRETPLYHRAMLGMARAIDYLAAEPYVDPTRFVYYGCSQGGGFGMYLTALWGKFAKSVFLCPNKCDMCAFVHGREPGSSHIKNQKPENVAAALEVAPWHDNCNFARMIKTPVGMMYGTADDNCQTVGGIAAFNCIASKDKRLRLLPGRGHGWHKADLERWLFNLEPTCTTTSKKGTEQ